MYVPSLRRMLASMAGAIVLCVPAVASADTPVFPLGVWSRPLPTAAPLDPNSPALANALAQYAATQVSFSMRVWNSRIYVVDNSQPKVPVVVDGPEIGGWPKHFLQAALDIEGGLPIPPGA